MFRHNLLPAKNRFRFVSEQGTKMGRRSLLHVEMDERAERVEVGGYVTPLIQAVMEF